MLGPGQKVLGGGLRAGDAVLDWRGTVEDGWPWATAPPHSPADKLHSLEIFVSSSSLFCFRAANPTNKHTVKFSFFFARKGLFNIKPTRVQEHQQGWLVFWR